MIEATLASDWFSTKMLTIVNVRKANKTIRDETEQIRKKCLLQNLVILFFIIKVPKTKKYKNLSRLLLNKKTLFERKILKTT